MSDPATSDVAEGPPLDPRNLDATGHRILDAVRELVGEFGARRMTVDDIAERAKVARITVFRRFESKENVITLTIQREQLRLLSQFETTAREASSLRDCLAQIFVLTIQSARTSPLFKRLIATEPQTLLVGYPSGGDPSPWAFARDYLAGLIITRGAAEGIVCDEPELIADILAHQIVSYSLLPTMLDLDDPVQLRHLADVVVESLL